MEKERPTKADILAEFPREDVRNLRRAMSEEEIERAIDDAYRQTEEERKRVMKPYGVISCVFVLLCFVCGATASGPDFIYLIYLFLILAVAILIYGSNITNKITPKPRYQAAFVKAITRHNREMKAQERKEAARLAKERREEENRREAHIRIVQAEFEPKAAELGLTLEALQSYVRECKEKGITLQDDLGQQRALRLAQSKDEWNIPGVETKYAEMFRLADDYQRRYQEEMEACEREKAMKELRPREETLARMNERAAKLTGLEKRRYMLQTRLDELKKQIKEKYQQEEEENRLKRLEGPEERIRQSKREVQALIAQAMLYQALSEKEKSWGVQAGLANGIAGPVAGAMVAGRIEAENAAIRQRNEALKDALFSAPFPVKATSSKPYSSVSASFASVSTEISSIEWGLKDLQNKVMDTSYPPQALMDRLNISVTTHASPTGAVIVEVSLKLSGALFKSGDKIMAVDGAFVAELSCDGETVGSAYIPLPAMGFEGGFNENEVKITGYCLTLDGNRKYSVNLSPYSLYLIKR